MRVYAVAKSDYFFGEDEGQIFTPPEVWAVAASEELAVKWIEEHVPNVVHGEAPLERHFWRENDSGDGLELIIYDLELLET